MEDRYRRMGEKRECMTNHYKHMQARMFADRRSCWVMKGSDAEVPDAREVAPELAAGRGRQRGSARSSRRAGVAAGIHRFCFFDSKAREGSGVFGSGFSRRSRTPARPPRAAAGLELLGLLAAGGGPAARADPGAPACFSGEARKHCGHDFKGSKCISHR